MPRDWVMTEPAIAAFVAGRRVAVAGVSRSGSQPANAVFRTLRDAGIEAIPINPQADRLEGCTSYRDLAAVPGSVDGLMVVMPPAAAESLVRQAAARGVRQVWFHRSFGEGSVSLAALRVHGTRHSSHRRRLPADVLRAG